MPDNATTSDADPVLIPEPVQLPAALEAAAQAVTGEGITQAFAASAGAEATEQDSALAALDRRLRVVEAKLALMEESVTKAFFQVASTHQEHANILGRIMHHFDGKI